MTRCLHKHWQKVRRHPEWVLNNKRSAGELPPLPPSHSLFGLHSPAIMHLSSTLFYCDRCRSYSPSDSLERQNSFQVVPLLTQSGRRPNDPTPEWWCLLAKLSSPLIITIINFYFTTCIQQLNLRPIRSADALDSAKFGEFRTAALGTATSRLCVDRVGLYNVGPSDALAVRGPRGRKGS